MLYLVIFIFLAFIGYVFLFLKVHISVEYVRNGWSDHIVLSASAIMGIIKYKYEISLVDINNNGIKFIRVKKKAAKKEKIEDKDKKRFGFGELYERIVYLKKGYDNYRHLSKRVNEYLKHKIILRELDLSIVLGTGDACVTGILSGAVWSVVGILISSLSSNAEFKKKHIDIKSDFSGQKLNINLFCIFSIKFVHIIVVGFILLSNYLKRRWFDWRNIRYKVL